jgi:hypothetical protein
MAALHKTAFSVSDQLRFITQHKEELRNLAYRGYVFTSFNGIFWTKYDPTVERDLAALLPRIKTSDIEMMLPSPSNDDCDGDWVLVPSQP